MADWRETLRRLIDTPPLMGIEVIQSPIETYVKELVGSYETYLRQQIQVHCDPDVLEQTARKNKELMEELDKIYDEIISGELVAVRHARWKKENDDWFDFFVCPECGRKEYHAEPYCNCGCKMDLKETEKGG